MNANTSGNDVGNVGFWPRGLIQRVRDQLSLALTQINKVLTGESTLATVDFIKQAASDAIPDDRMAEIVRRLIVTIETSNQGTVVFQATEPTDKTKVWWKTDATTNLPTGVPLTWIDADQKWEPIVDQQTIAASVKKRRTASIYTPAGLSAQNVLFTDIGTTDYVATATPTTFYNNQWNPPGVIAPTFTWTLINKASNQVTFQFYAVPTGGLTWDICIMEKE